MSALAVLSEDTAVELERFKVPVVSFNATHTNRWVSSVCCDNKNAARMIADHFIERGASRFAFLAGPPESPANMERLEGCSTRLSEKGFSLDYIAGDNFTYESGYNAALGILKCTPLPHAIVCADDLIGLGAIDAARGFDDIPSASWEGYQMTTFEQNADRMVDEALAILRQFSEDDSFLFGVRKLIAPNLTLTKVKVTMPCGGRLLAGDDREEG